MKTLFAAVLLLLTVGSSLSQAATAAETVRVARYTQIVGASEAERDALAIVARLRFPRPVVITVGDGLRYLLQRTGYSVVAGDADAEHLLALPLPESHRQLGPHRVRTLAQILVGDAFWLCADARQRTLSVVVRDDTNPAAPCETHP
jgi:type IV pili sensor histidine kinase/response regulator